EGLDTGPVVDALEVEVLPEDDAGTLRLRLAELGAHLVEAALPAYLEGRLPPREQDPREATYAPPLRKEELLIDWKMPASEIHNRIRALAPSPGARGRLGGKWMKILRSRPREDVLGLQPGELAGEGKREMLVGTGHGALEVLQLQPEGRRRMEAAEFLRGYRGGKGGFFEAVVGNG
ncbi:MAG: methionyl-tRNA formyltransferase, partial [Actinomycetota bacterium]|nr:methionyl-tRNA formyltransferase [Actinomycetota bacterium]